MLCAPWGGICAQSNQHGSGSEVAEGRPPRDVTGGWRVTGGGPARTCGNGGGAGGAASPSGGAASVANRWPMDSDTEGEVGTVVCLESCNKLEVRGLDTRAGGSDPHLWSSSGAVRVADFLSGTNYTKPSEIVTCGIAHAFCAVQGPAL